MYTPAPEVAGGGLEGEGEGDMWWDSEGSVGLEGRVMVGVASADGEMFRQRLTMLSSLLASLRVSAVYAKAVARDMVAEGGPLEVCRPVRPGEEGLPDSYFANGLNQLQLMLRAWRDGYSHVLVLEDDVALAPQFANVAYARQVLREVAAEAPREYDIVFLGDCCDIAAKDRPAQAAAARVGSWLIRTERASRCSNAYLISRRGMQKMLVHVPAWCSLDWMMNAAKYAVAAPALQTQVQGSGFRLWGLGFRPWPRLLPRNRSPASPELSWQRALVASTPHTSSCVRAGGRAGGRENGRHSVPVCTLARLNSHLPDTFLIHGSAPHAFFDSRAGYMRLGHPPSPPPLLLRFRARLHLRLSLLLLALRPRLLLLDALLAGLHDGAPHVCRGLKDWHSHDHSRARLALWAAPVRTQRQFIICARSNDSFVFF